MDVSKELTLSLECTHGFKTFTVTWYFYYHFFTSFYFFKISFSVLRHIHYSFIRGITQIPSSPLFPVSLCEWFTQLLSILVEEGQCSHSCCWLQLALEDPMSRALNSPLLLRPQLAHLGSGQASSTKRWHILAPTNLTAQALLTRFCLETIQGTKKHCECICAVKCSLWDIYRKYFLNVLSLNLYLWSVEKNRIFPLSIWFSM